MDGDSEIQEGAEVPSGGDAAGEAVQEQPQVHSDPDTDTTRAPDGQMPPPNDPPPPPSHEPSPTPPGRRIARYVLASGPNMGATVAVFPMGTLSFNEETGDKFSDLALVDAPEIPYQSQARYSEGNEPGTWQWA